VSTPEAKFQQSLLDGAQQQPNTDSLVQKTSKLDSDNTA